MTSYGYTLSGEEFSPSDLVAAAERAERAGFDFVSMSDHFHPWTSTQGHSPFVWSVLGAVAHATEQIDVGIGVTCPIMRIHPVVLAQATATLSLLLDGRFFWGVGTGEALNEHILGQHWPAPEVRLEMLEEAVGVIRALWAGETVDHYGRYYTVENARIFDPPAAPMTLAMFRKRAAKHGVRLDLRSQLLYDDTHVYVNGTAMPSPRNGREALRRLADDRALSPNAAARLSPATAAILYNWYRDGYVHASIA